MEPRKRGDLVIIVGPSTVGKTDVIAGVLRRLPSAARLVTTTTRPPRKGEIDDVHYHFLDRAEFERKLARGEFLEHNEFDDNLYGSSRIVVEDMLRKYDTVFAILDVNGARKALQAFPEAASIFIRPESLLQLRKRLEARGTSEADIAWRLDRAREEMAAAHKFGTVVTNREGELDRTIEKIVDIIKRREIFSV